ncbi:MAG: hypothetical protein LC689_17325 [Myxococcales bacterium]|nr:hypothetical protein [Myxococcales bacterium]
MIAILLAAGASGHRAKAERAEALGHMQEAAHEYEAAWQDEQAPELLYRLGIVRRKLKQYGKAREAFRAYLRDAPEGGLREEVERQLKKLEVLIEAQSEDYSDEPALRKPARAPPPPPPPPVVEPVRPVEPAPPTPVVEPPRAVAPPPVPAPAAAVAAAPPPVAPVARTRVAPWLAAGAAVTAAAGAYFWWDGARISRDLDARYSSGDLTTADRPSYSRAHNESLAGRLLVAAAVGLTVGAVILW